MQCLNLLKMNKNKDDLDSFVHYCNRHPEQRFFQCLRNWSDNKFMLVTDSSISAMISMDVGCKDTFYFEGRNK